MLFEKIGQIKHYQKEIKELRKQLQESYNIERIIQLEDQLKLTQMKIQDLKDEEVALKRVEQEQKVALT